MFDLTSIQLLSAGYPTEVEEVDLLILSSQWAGMANVQQVLSELHSIAFFNFKTPSGLTLVSVSLHFHQESHIFFLVTF